VGSGEDERADKCGPNQLFHFEVSFRFRALTISFRRGESALLAFTSQNAAYFDQ
jgi:hypothetical protein